MPEILEQLQAILKPLKIHLAPVRDGDPLASLMPFKEDYPKYALDEAGNIIGLNLARTGLTDEKWQEIMDVPGLADHLQALNLCENELTEIHFPASMTALRFLNLSENKNLQSVGLQEMSPSAPLEWLDLSECAITIFFFSSFLNLQKLDISRNKLTKFFIQGNCPKLFLLDASGNQLTTFELYGAFEALKYLYLNDNQLETLGFKLVLNALEILHLRNNKLERLPDLLLFPQMQTLYLFGNPLADIPKAVIAEGESENSWITVRDYLREFRKGTIVNNRVKIIIVGNGRSGKTSIFRRIKDLPFREDEAFTHGIKLGDFDKKDLPDVKTAELQANVWDFGGQEIFYATHQFFLTDDALYILAWTKEENVIPHRERDKSILPTNEKWRSREYWLESIRHHGKDSPILMVQTHSDKSREIINPLEYKKEPYNADCLDFSAFDDEGLSQLKRQITLKLNEEITEFGKPSPKTYIQVINEVENRRNQNRMSREEFVEICRGAGITPEAENSVLNFLHVTGSVVWFPTVAALQDTVFINPDWLTKQVYRLINNDLHAKKGRLSEAYLDTVFPDYSNEERQQFLELLKGFELIFEDKSVETDRFIAPQYLPEKLEADTKQLYDDIFEELQLAFKFRFPKFIPDNVMVNFLSRYGPFSRKVYWKNGIFFKHHNTEKCIVTFEESSNCLFVYTKKDEPNSQLLQYEVCQAFVELSKNANAEIALEGKPFVSWQKLVEAHKLENKNLLATDDTTVLAVKDFLVFLDPRNLDTMMEKSRHVGFSTKADKDQPRILKEIPTVAYEPLDLHSSTGKTKILFIAAHTDASSRLQTDVEHSRIVEELERGKARDKFEFLQPKLAVTIRELVRAMNDKPHIVHFSGHGASEGIYITTDNNQPKLMPTEALQSLFKQLQGITRIVVLNACYSAEQAKTISAFGMYVVGNKLKITDAAAISFSIGFYNGLGEGKSFENSFTDAITVVLCDNPAAAGMIEVWLDGVQLNPKAF